MPPTLAGAAPDRACGAVLAIALYGARCAAPQAIALAQAIAGTGLAGDRHADAASPRQLLLAGAPAYARHGLPAHALGENLLLDIDTAALRSGSLLRIGAHALLSLSFQCEPCGQLDRHQPGLARRIGAQRGMLARVVQGGAIAVGDTVLTLTPTAAVPAAPAWSDDWRDRVARVLRAVPDGMVIEYGQLARVAGVQSAYCRAFPRLARTLGLAHKAVGARGDGAAMRWDGGTLWQQPSLAPRKPLILPPSPPSDAP